MTTWAVVVAFVATLDPFRRRDALSVTRARDVWAGGALAAVVYALVAVLGATTRDALDVSAPNARLAAGLVLVAAGVHATVRAPASFTTDAPTRTDWLVPVCFPVLLRPDLALVALAADGAVSVATIAGSAVLAVAVTGAWWSAAPEAADRRVVRGASGVLSVALVVAAVRLLLDGLFAI